MSQKANEEDNPYLGELLLVSIHFYLKSIAFRCLIKHQVDESLAFHGCRAMGSFMIGG
jgi:hypothetical protein